MQNAFSPARPKLCCIVGMTNSEFVTPSRSFREGATLLLYLPAEAMPFAFATIYAEHADCRRMIRGCMLACSGRPEGWFGLKVPPAVKRKGQEESCVRPLAVNGA